MLGRLNPEKWSLYSHNQVRGHSDSEGKIRPIPGIELQSPKLQQFRVKKLSWVIRDFVYQLLKRIIRFSRKQPFALSLTTCNSRKLKRWLFRTRWLPGYLRFLCCPRMTDISMNMSRLKLHVNDQFVVTTYGFLRISCLTLSIPCDQADRGQINRTWQYW